MLFHRLLQKMLRLVPIICSFSSPFDEFFPSKTWLQISLCVAESVRVCVHPLNKDVSQAIIGTFYHCLFQNMFGWVAFKVSQGNPTTVFCKISVWRSKYCLEFSITWGRLKISWRPLHSRTIFEAQVINSLRFLDFFSFFTLHSPG